MARLKAESPFTSYNEKRKSSANEERWLMSQYGAETCKDSKSLQATKLRLLKKLRKPSGKRLLLRALEVNLNTIQRTLLSPNNTKRLSQSTIFTKGWKEVELNNSITRNNQLTEQTIDVQQRSIETSLALNSPHAKKKMHKILVQDAETFV